MAAVSAAAVGGGGGYQEVTMSSPSAMSLMSSFRVDLHPLYPDYQRALAVLLEAHRDGDATLLKNTTPITSTDAALSFLGRCLLDESIRRVEENEERKKRKDEKKEQRRQQQQQQQQQQNNNDNDDNNDDDNNDDDDDDDDYFSEKQRRIRNEKEKEKERQKDARKQCILEVVKNYKHVADVQYTTGTAAYPYKGREGEVVYPLVMALAFRENDEIIHAILDACPGACACKDNKGFHPLDVAVQCDASAEIINKIAKLQPHVAEGSLEEASTSSAAAGEVSSTRAFAIPAPAIFHTVGTLYDAEWVKDVVLPLYELSPRAASTPLGKDLWTGSYLFHRACCNPTVQGSGFCSWSPCDETATALAVIAMWPNARCLLPRSVIEEKDVEPYDYPIAILGENATDHHMFSEVSFAVMYVIYVLMERLAPSSAKDIRNNFTFGGSPYIDWLEERAAARLFGERERTAMLKRTCKDAATRLLHWSNVRREVKTAFLLCAKKCDTNKYALGRVGEDALRLICNAVDRQGVESALEDPAVSPLFRTAEKLAFR